MIAAFNRPPVSIDEFLDRYPDRSQHRYERTALHWLSQTTDFPLTVNQAFNPV
jgi:hypothetical protein